MSVGSFVWTKYKSVESPSQIYRIHCQEEMLLLTIGGVQNIPPIGDVNMSYSITTSKGRRGRSVVSPFRVKLRWQLGAPSGYDPHGDLWVPLLAESIRRHIEKGVTGVYLGMLVDVRETQPEKNF